MANMSDVCDPCQTGEGPPPTLCDGDTSNNEWYEEGICLLDTMTREQVIWSLERNPKARDDIKRVTTCVDLLLLAEQVPLLPVEQEDDIQQRNFNQNDCLPYFTIFRGNFNDM
jgi:hypothetical protein